jgi:hypothetical protein
VKLARGFRGQLSSPEAIEHELDHMTAQIRGGWKVEHDADGSHRDIVVKRGSKRLVTSSRKVSIDNEDGIETGGPLTWKRASVLHPPQLTASVNDWAPVGIDNANRIELTSSSALVITGIRQFDPNIDRWLALVNKGAYTITLEHNSTSSRPYNRISCPNSADFDLDPDQASIFLYYSSRAGNWEIFAAPDLSAFGGGTTPPPTGAFQNTFLLSGGDVAWESGYSYRVSAAEYYINGTRFTSTEQTITLDAADATNDRLDIIALDTTGTVVKITGTAATNPSEPTTDPASDLKLALVLVSASTTQPVGVTTETLYAENAGSGGGEWNWSTSGSGFSLASTTTPHAGTKDIEGTTVTAGSYAQGQRGSGSVDPNAYDHVRFFLRSKAAWNNNRGLLVSFRSAGVLVGTAVQIRRTGTFGFDSTNTSAYQQLAIPTTAFAIPAATTANQLRVEDFGGSIGFFLDDISLQAAASTPATGGITQAQADARYAPLAPSFVTINAESGLPNERRLTAGTAISVTDGGAGSTVTVSVTSDGVTNTQLANMTAATIKGRAFGAGTGDPTDLTANQVSTILDGATDPFVRTSAAPGSYSDEQAQDAVGNILDDGGDIDFTYDDATPKITASIKTGVRTTSVEVQFDGGGAAIAANTKARFDVPLAATLTKIRVLADQSGSIVFDIWKDTYANYPPTNADTIINTGAGGTKPTLSSADHTEDSTLSHYTTNFSAGDTVIVNVDSCSTITQALIVFTFSY